MRAKKIRWFKNKQIQEVDNKQILEQLSIALEIDKEEDGTERAPGRAIDLESNLRIDSDNQEALDIGMDKMAKKVLYDKVQAKINEDKQNLLNMDVPDYLVCRITDELMDEPVILSSGFTYEKE